MTATEAEREYHAELREQHAQHAPTAPTPSQQLARVGNDLAVASGTAGRLASLLELGPASAQTVDRLAVLRRLLEEALGAVSEAEREAEDVVYAGCVLCNERCVDLVCASCSEEGA